MNLDVWGRRCLEETCTRRVKLMLSSTDQKAASVKCCRSKMAQPRNTKRQSDKLTVEVAEGEFIQKDAR